MIVLTLSFMDEFKESLEIPMMVAVAAGKGFFIMADLKK